MGFFLLRFPHEKFWVTRELDFASAAKKFENNEEERVTVFIALLFWPITIAVFVVIHFFAALCIGADNLLDLLLTKMKGEDNG